MLTTYRPYMPEQGLLLPESLLDWLYATGVFSSRKMVRKLYEDVACRVLCANNYPAHRTIREFRQLHLKEFSELFVQVVKLARETGLVSLGRVGIDGTKIKANASKQALRGAGA